MAQIIDGFCDFDNVLAEEIARHNISMYGTGDYVLQVDECLGYELVSNNEIHIKDGLFIIQGRRGYIKKGTTDICTIENGAQAVNRNDIVVIEYAKDEVTMLESHTTKIIKGVAGEIAVDPELVTGDINAGAILHQMPLYRVKVEGLNVVAVEQMFEMGSVAAETVNPMVVTKPGFAADALAVKEQFDELNSNLAAINSLTKAYEDRIAYLENFLEDSLFQEITLTGSGSLNSGSVSNGQVYAWVEFETSFVETPTITVVETTGSNTKGATYGEVTCSGFYVIVSSYYKNQDVSYSWTATGKTRVQS